MAKRWLPVTWGIYFLFIYFNQSEWAGEGGRAGLRHLPSAPARLPHPQIRHDTAPARILILIYLFLLLFFLSHSPSRGGRGAHPALGLPLPLRGRPPSPCRICGAGASFTLGGGRRGAWGRRPRDGTRRGLDMGRWGRGGPGGNRVGPAGPRGSEPCGWGGDGAERREAERPRQGPEARSPRCRWRCRPLRGPSGAVRFSPGLAPGWGGPQCAGPRRAAAARRVQALPE